MKTTTTTNGSRTTGLGSILAFGGTYLVRPKIEKNVPLKGRQIGARQTNKYFQEEAVREMEIGDSVFYPCADTAKMQARISAAFSQEGRKTRPHRKFTTSQQEGGVRVWRVK